MFQSPIDNENGIVKTDLPVDFKLTYFNLKGSHLEIEGYASIKGIFSYSEDKIRKTLLLRPEVNIELFREETKFDDELKDLTDQEIVEMHTINIPINNARGADFEEIEHTQLENKDSYGWFKLKYDLEKVKDGMPLEKGIYTVYLKLEQIDNHDENIKYLKIVPLSSINQYIKSGIIKTNLNYFSANLNKKYTLIASFDSVSKSLLLENKLLQSYNPKKIPDETGQKEENRYIQAIKKRFFKLMYILFTILPINKNKITFASDSRNELTGNLYFIYEELYKRDLNLKLKFMLSERIDNRKTFFNLFKTAFHFATSKIILLDDFYPFIYPLKIKRRTELIQVWHAAGAFKTFGFSRMGMPGGPSIKSKNHRNYTKATVSSEGVRRHYAEGFGIPLDYVHATGIPRSDIFFDEEYKAHVKKRLMEKYPMLQNKKVILFSPTFRGNGQASAYFPFQQLEQKRLYESLKDEYIFLYKIHPFVKNELYIPYEYSDFFYDFSDFREINDLLLIADILITDYSSVCFEFALLNKPMLFFGFDVEDYIRTRDFYYNYFDFIPGTLVKDTNEIVQAILKKEFKSEKIKPFIEYFFNNNLGNATKNVVDNVIIPSLSFEEQLVVKREKPLPPPKSRIELFERILDEDSDDV